MTHTLPPTRRLALAALLCLAAAACGGSDSPNNPSPTPPTPVVNRTIELGGPLEFGDVQIGQTADRELRIANRGTSTLTITGMTGPGGFTASWTSGTIPAGGQQSVNVRFAPTESRSYSGTLTVNGDQTAGTNTMAVNARGVPVPRPRFGRTGVGNAVFDMPKDVTRLRIIGIYNANSSNFIIHAAGRGVVNELLGTAWNQTRYQGDHVVPAACAQSTGTTCVIEVLNSSGVEWSFEEIG